MSGHRNLDAVDRADRLIYQAHGLLDLMGAASISERQTEHESIEAAAMLVRDLLAELKGIVNAKA